MLTKALIMDQGWNWVWPNEQRWVVYPVGSALVWFNAFYDILLAIWGIIGAVWSALAWRYYGSPETRLARASRAQQRALTSQS